MKEKIKIRIFKDGHIEAETLGIKGKKCTNYIEILEKMLNAKTTDSEYTSEYYEEVQKDINLVENKMEE